MSIFVKIANYILDYIFVKNCLCCRKNQVQDAGICYECFADLSLINDSICSCCGTSMPFSNLDQTLCLTCHDSKQYFDKFRSLYVYSGSARVIIHQFKYNDATSASDYFAKQFWQRYRNDIKEANIICPVPMYKFKRIRRKYNPPFLICKSIKKYFPRAALYHDVLIKTKNTRSQTGLSRAERQKNISDSIIYNSKIDISGKNILLIDDVYTTGATSELCCKLLKEKGAAKIFFLSIARV